MNNNEIIMDLEDYKSILTHNGKIDGIVGTCKINEFNKNLEPIKNSIKKAKGILIKFGIHINQSLFIINDYMSQIHDLTINDAEIISQAPYFPFLNITHSPPYTTKEPTDTYHVDGIPIFLIYTNPP